MRGFELIISKNYQIKKNKFVKVDLLFFAFNLKEDLGVIDGFIFLRTDNTVDTLFEQLFIIGNKIMYSARSNSI